MASPLRSIADLMANDASLGSLHQLLNIRTTPATSAATTGSGYQSIQCWDRDYTVPTMDASCQGAYATNVRFGAGNQQGAWLAYKKTLGNLTTANVFSGSASMPSRKVHGNSSSIQLATTLPVLYIESANTTAAGGITFSIGYTNQDGTSGRSLTLVTGASPLRYTGYLLSPHLQSGDTGIRSIDSMSQSGATGSATFGIHGLVNLGYEPGIFPSVPIPAMPRVQMQLQGGDTLRAYRSAAGASSAILCSFTLVPEPV